MDRHEDELRLEEFVNITKDKIKDLFRHVSIFPSPDAKGIVIELGQKVDYSPHLTGITVEKAIINTRNSSLFFRGLKSYKKYPNKKDAVELYNSLCKKSKLLTMTLSTTLPKFIHNKAYFYNDGHFLIEDKTEKIGKIFQYSSVPGRNIIVHDFNYKGIDDYFGLESIFPSNGYLVRVSEEDMQKTKEIFPNVLEVYDGHFFKFPLFDQEINKIENQLGGTIVNFYGNEFTIKGQPEISYKSNKCHISEEGIDTNLFFDIAKSINGHDHDNKMNVQFSLNNRDPNSPLSYSSLLSMTASDQNFIGGGNMIRIIYNEPERSTSIIMFIDVNHPTFIKEQQKIFDDLGVRIFESEQDFFKYHPESLN